MDNQKAEPGLEERSDSLMNTEQKEFQSPPSFEACSYRTHSSQILICLPWVQRKGIKHGWVQGK